MSKAVLLSIKPKYCTLIAGGEKTLEVRKTAPKLKTPFKCYIYCTTPQQKYLHRCKNSENEWYIDREPFCDGIIYGGKVVGEFTCDRISWEVKDCTDDAPGYRSLLEGSDLTLEELNDYGNWGVLYGWHISDLKIYDEPKELRGFTALRDTKFGLEPVTPTRPPQSWQYVKEAEV